MSNLQSITFLTWHLKQRVQNLLQEHRNSELQAQAYALYQPGNIHVFFISNSFISNSSTFRKKFKQLTSGTRKFLATGSQIFAQFFCKIAKNGPKPQTGGKF